MHLRLLALQLQKRHFHDCKGKCKIISSWVKETFISLRVSFCFQTVFSPARFLWSYFINKAMFKIALWSIWLAKMYIFNSFSFIFLFLHYMFIHIMSLLCVPLKQAIRRPLLQQIFVEWLLIKNCPASRQYLVKYKKKIHAKYKINRCIGKRHVPIFI